MSGFSSEWLALRAPLDLAARSRAVETAFIEALPKGALRLLDLASGTGSTVEALSSLLDRPVTWQLTDYDPALLQVARERWPESIHIRQIDLQADLEQLPFDEVEAVTTSAFLDLASQDFLERLADKVVATGKPFLASLTYDGRSDFDPGHPTDAELLETLNRHQKSDKGFGPALGPDAATTAVSLFEDRGFQVVSGRSDWQISPKASAFLLEFLGGWLRVGKELNLPDDLLDSWWQDRKERINSGTLAMTVGHIDFVALP
ncbi:class I SAM-dependent methyltransferase [Roseibium sp.]|uniref:class I SAM-dependent methyltransferase n=1 Tax=Roseibium sp. TaxID=1936156 RepID=UPI003BB15FAC